MPRGKKQTAAQIIGMLREAEVELARGRTVPDVVRMLGVTDGECPSVTMGADQKE